MTAELTASESYSTGTSCSGAALDLLRIVRINEEIKRVVSVAFKINIMALNAIFLAKRAGNAALGFGVLSNELRVFSRDLRESMMSLTQLIHDLVGEVSVILLESRQDELFRKTVGGCPGNVRLGVPCLSAGKHGTTSARHGFRPCVEACAWRSMMRRGSSSWVGCWPSRQKLKRPTAQGLPPRWGRFRASLTVSSRRSALRSTICGARAFSGGVHENDTDHLRGWNTQVDGHRSRSGQGGLI
jgi:hypothetical protein